MWSELQSQTQNVAHFLMSLTLLLGDCWGVWCLCASVICSQPKTLLWLIMPCMLLVFQNYKYMYVIKRTKVLFKQLLIIISFSSLVHYCPLTAGWITDPVSCLKVILFLPIILLPITFPQPFWIGPCSPFRIYIQRIPFLFFSSHLHLVWAPQTWRLHSWSDHLLLHLAIRALIIEPVKQCTWRAPPLCTSFVMTV